MQRKLARAAGGVVGILLFSVGLAWAPALSTTAWGGAEWSGVFAVGVGPELPTVGLDLRGTDQQTKLGLSIDWTGLTRPADWQKESFEATISREMSRWELKAEIYGSATGALAASDAPRHAMGLDLSALDHSSGRPAILEGGVRLRQYAFPIRPSGDHREAGYYLKTGFRLDDAPSAIWSYFDPAWLSGLAGLARDSLPESDDVPLPEWYLGSVVEPRQEWFSALTGDAGDQRAQRRVITATVRREYTSRDYALNDDLDRESYSDTVTLVEKKGDSATTLQHSATQRVYPGPSPETYLLRELTLRTGRASSSGAWEIEGGLDDKEYPYDSLAGYSQLRGGGTYRWRSAGPGRGDLEISAQSRWRRYPEGGSQSRTSVEAGLSLPRGTEVKAAYATTDNRGPGIEADDRQTVRVRVTKRQPLGERLVLSAGLAVEWEAVRDDLSGWGRFTPSSVAQAQLQLRF